MKFLYVLMIDHASAFFRCALVNPSFSMFSFYIQEFSGCASFLQTFTNVSIHAVLGCY